ncbi:MAG: UDP-glucose/GDP-mannose dehydrogenase family protein [Candidatus Altiarchaeota archaeon]|nr:UDP-glucose/GDP-mannose dehydrogenase family protein [Candidatus Altiarchaeota archaeon]
MEISVIGAGYVGLITAAGLAEKGHNVLVIDIQKEKVDMINAGKSPLYEEGLEEILRKNSGKRLKATTDGEKSILDTDVTFICVQTPADFEGAVDLRPIKRVAENVGKTLKKKKTYHVVVVKSTVPPSTTEKTVTPILEENSGKKAGRDFGVVMSPEFLREGIAIKDFLNPDRVIIGATEEKAYKTVEEIYRGFNCPIYRTDPRTAEMIKYASNIFLATKISFINDIGNICKKLDIDTYKVAEGLSMDKRISPHFLNAGLGWGGSCFPKDIRGLVHKAKELGYEPKLVDGVIKINEEQPKIMVRLGKKRLGTLEGKKAAVLGLAFKPNTDDIRDSQALPVIEYLLKEDACVVVYDPKAMENAKKTINGRITFAKTAQEALKDADIAFITTAWEEFRELDYSGMKKPIIVDGRNLLRHRKDIIYEGLCW